MTGLRRSLVTGLGVVLALVVTLLIFRLPLVDSVRLILSGAFGDKFGVARTLLKSIPLILTGLGVVVAWRGGMFNIGGEGQYLVGALAAATVARPMLAHPGPGVPYLMLAASGLGGAAWAWLAGWLYVRRGVEVVISTILLNFIAAQFVGWAITGPLQEAKHQLPVTDLLPSEMMLFRFDRQTDLHGGLFVALLAVGAVWLFLFRTRGGFEVRLVGAGPGVARANRLDPAKIQLRALAISGALCGLAGGVEYVGVAGQIGTGFSQNWGFLGIPVAILGNLNPVGALASALTFGALFAGSENLARFTPAGTTLIYVIQSVAVLTVVVMRGLSGRKRKGGESA